MLVIALVFIAILLCSTDAARRTDVDLRVASQAAKCFHDTVVADAAQDNFACLAKQVFYFVGHTLASPEKLMIRHRARAGRRVVPVFTSLSLLSVELSQRTHYLALRGDDLLAVMATGRYDLHINPVTTYDIYLACEDIATILHLVQRPLWFAWLTASQRCLAICAPKVLPEDMVSAFLPLLIHKQHIKSAFLVRRLTTGQAGSQWLLAIVSFTAQTCEIEDVRALLAHDCPQYPVELLQISPGQDEAYWFAHGEPIYSQSSTAGH